MSLTNPTLDVIDQYLDELLDKQGSDYFPLPIKLDRFISKTYDFLRSNLVYMDANQTISDDIRPLLVERTGIEIIKDDELNLWKVPVPTDYHRLITLCPLEGGRRHSREVRILKNGQEDYEFNPFRNASKTYPNVYRVGGFFHIETGSVDNSNYDSAWIKYCKEPTFAKETELDKKIVDLPLQSIIQICNYTADSFRYTASDTFAQQNESHNSRFGKKNRS